MSAAKNIANQNFDLVQEKINVIQRYYTEKITALASAGKISEMQASMKEMQEKILNIQSGVEENVVPAVNAVATSNTTLQPTIIQTFVQAPIEPIQRLDLPELICPIVKLAELKEKKEDSFIHEEIDPIYVPYVQDDLFAETEEDVTSPHLTLPLIEERPSHHSQSDVRFNYSHPLSDLNIDQYIFKKEREEFEKLVHDEHFLQFLDQNINEYTFDNYKHVVKLSTSLHVDVFKPLYQSVDTCIEKLKMKNSYCLLYYPDNEQLVEIYPDDQNKLHIIVNKDFINSYSNLERTFILGRHFGHYLCNHLIMPFAPILEKSKGQLNAAHTLSLYEWSLYTEVTADRFGFLCSEDKNAGYSFFFKNQYGLNPNIFEKNWQECLLKWEHHNFSQDAEYRCNWLLGYSFHPARFQLLKFDYDAEIFYKNFNYKFLFTNQNDPRWKDWQHSIVHPENQPEFLLVQSFISHLHEQKIELSIEERFQFLMELTIILKTLDMNLSSEAYQLALAFEIPSEYIDKILSFV